MNPKISKKMSDFKWNIPNIFVNISTNNWDYMYETSLIIKIKSKISNGLCRL
jgi:hypothetical protein